jgi:hypothetical protein
MMVGKIVSRDGKLFVLYETSDFSEPKITHIWWQIVRTTGNPYHCNRPAEGDVATFRGNGEWSTHDGKTNVTSGSVNTGSGDSKAAHVVTFSAPAPKVRSNVETRWQDGRWQKYSKRQGWISV